MTEACITLPWPAKVLSPNGRPKHWAAKYREAKKARGLAKSATMAALGTSVKPGWAAAKLDWVLHPKTANMPDADNAQAALKNYQDGIADALGIDDSLFSCTYAIGAPVKGGAVHVVLSPDYRDVAA
jgi:crossover junction endodeoxyribonuclease RusA